MQFHYDKSLLNSNVPNDILISNNEEQEKTKIIFDYLSKFLRHMRHIDIYRYYIALDIPDLLEEKIPEKKIEIFGINVDNYNLSKNYPKFFNAFLGKICNKENSFCYCTMLRKALSKYTFESYKLDTKVDYYNVFLNMRNEVKNAIMKVLYYIFNNNYNFEKLFLWKENRKMLDKGKIAYFSFKHPLYNVFKTINTNDFLCDANKIEELSEKLISGYPVIACGYLLIPEDFGLDTGIGNINNENNIDEIVNLLTKFTNRCFQELIDNGYYDLFLSNKNIYQVSE